MLVWPSTGNTFEKPLKDGSMMVMALGEIFLYNKEGYH
jgi:hypothetical protein